MIINLFTRDDLVEAAHKAFEHHNTKPQVVEFKVNFDANIDKLYSALLDGTWNKYIYYTRTRRINNNGKIRYIDTPDLNTRIYQHCFLIKIIPIYNKLDPMAGLNCKKGCGITAKSKKGSVIHNLAHCFYDLLEYKYYLVIDQRQCYPHCSIKVFRKALKGLGIRGDLADFAIKICFVSDGRLPIGTPTSPMVHHIIMLDFDRYFIETNPDYRRYADNAFFPCESAQEANTIKWRVRNFWWYRYSIRYNRRETLIEPMEVPLDFCGYVFHRNDKCPTQHDKGFISMRYDILRRCRHATDNNWSSYYGLMKRADLWNEMNRIQDEMKLELLTEKIRINRNLDAPTIDIKELVGIKFDIKDYDLRRDKEGKANWIKCLIGIPEFDFYGNPTGRKLAKEFHGGYSGIVEWIVEVEKQYKKEDILPLEEVEVINQSGYIFKGSTNQLVYI